MGNDTPAITHMRIGGHLYPIGSLIDASRMFREALAQWPDRHSGVVNPELVTAGGVVVGYVTDDGRCWLGTLGGGVCVYDPEV